jgi:hypothetical protein
VQALRLLTPSTISTTAGGDPSTGSLLDPGFKHGENQSISLRPLAPPLTLKQGPALEPSLLRLYFAEIRECSPQSLLSPAD